MSFEGTSRSRKQIETDDDSSSSDAGVMVEEQIHLHLKEVKKKAQGIELNNFSPLSPESAGPSPSIPGRELETNPESPIIPKIVAEFTDVPLNTFAIGEFFMTKNSYNRFESSFVNPRVLPFFGLASFIGDILGFLVLFDSIPHQIIYFKLVLHLCVISPFYFVLNTQILKLILKTFDFWYCMAQSLILEFCFAMLVGWDYRVIIPIHWFFQTPMNLLIDSCPELIRNTASRFYMGVATVWAIVGLFIHFNYLPKIEDVEFSAYGFTYSLRQVYLSSSATIVLFYLRYIFESLRSPEKFILIVSQLHRK